MTTHARGRARFRHRPRPRAASLLRFRAAASSVQQARDVYADIAETSRAIGPMTGAERVALFDSIFTPMPHLAEDYRALNDENVIGGRGAQPVRV